MVRGHGGLTSFRRRVDLVRVRLLVHVLLALRLDERLAAVLDDVQAVPLGELLQRLQLGVPRRHLASI